MAKKSKINVRKAKEIKYHFSFINKILLFLTLPFWFLPTLIINLILGKKIRNKLQEFPKTGLVPFAGFEGIDFNSLAFYNCDLQLRNADKNLFISTKEWTKINPKDVLISTFDQTTLAAFLLINKKAANKWIVVLHGWIQNRYQILYLAKHFYEAGYNVLVYDARNHGSNPNTSCTFGLEEAKDLFFVLKYLNKEYKNQELEFALIGNSMGATTILQSLVSYDLAALGVKSAIFDCGYDDFSHMIKILGQAKINYHWFWYFYGLNFWFWMQDKFYCQEIKPIAKLQNCAKTPILFIHGAKDQTVPITMTKRLFHKKISYEKKSSSKLLIFENAKHVDCVLANYSLYKKATLKFVAQWFNKKK